MSERKASGPSSNLIAALCVTSVFLLGVAVGAAIALTQMRGEAADHGAGRWVVDEKTGHTQWEWTGRQP